MRATWHSDSQSGEALHAFAEREIGIELLPGTIMAVSHAGVLRGVVLFNNYQPDAGIIEIHAAATGRWLSRNVLREMFDFPFNQIGCQAVILRASEHHKRVARIAQAFGFLGYKIPRLRGVNEAEMIFVLTKEAWAENGFH